MRMILRFRQKLSRVLLVGTLGLTTIGMQSCDDLTWNEQASLARVQAKGPVVVLTTKNPLIYIEKKSGEYAGMDHDLFESFSKHYGLNVKYVVLPDEESVLRALSKGEGDVGAARLRTLEDSEGFIAAPAYDETYLSLFCQKRLNIQNIDDLHSRRVLLLNKDNFRGFADRLRQLSPSTELEIIDNTKALDLIKAVQNGNADCFVGETLNGDFYLRYYPQLEKITAFSDSYSLSWLLTSENQDLLKLIQAWYRHATRSDEISRVVDHYKSYLNQLSRHDISTFFKKVKSTLPEYKSTFVEAAKEQGLPWQLIAAVAYQESHWEAEARSYTGVRGLMQLTTDTAKHMGIEDRTDPHQSIRGGSKYLRYLMDQLPDEVHPRERLSLALAAYNIGILHLKDAQALAEKTGRNPNSWLHLREVLPLLADPDYANRLEYGPARGQETVDFVERVRSFYNLMTASVH